MRAPSAEILALRRAWISARARALFRRVLEAPCKPILAKQLNRMLGSFRPVPAGQGIPRAKLVAPPAVSLGVCWVRWKPFRHFSYVSAPAVAAPVLDSEFSPLLSRRTLLCIKPAPSGITASSPHSSTRTSRPGSEGAVRVPGTSVPQLVEKGHLSCLGPAQVCNPSIVRADVFELAGQPEAATHVQR